MAPCGTVRPLNRHTCTRFATHFDAATLARFELEALELRVASIRSQSSN
jgi:hypothetical protein